MNKINVLGMGPGHKDYILPITLRLIEKSDVLIGGRRILKDFEETNKEMVYINKDLLSIIEYIKENKDKKRIALLLSGDTGFYSMLEFIKKHFHDESLNVIPGISSYQYLISKLKKTWHNSFVGSVHGRELDIVETVKNNSTVILLTDNKYSPSNIAKLLINEGLNDRTIYVGENLSYENERIIKGSPKDIVELEKKGMSVVVIEHEG